jgi:hypothetical protein
MNNKNKELIQIITVMQKQKLDDKPIDINNNIPVKDIQDLNVEIIQ